MAPKIRPVLGGRVEAALVWANHTTTQKEAPMNGHQPTNHMDTRNPPKGGSGVPRKRGYSRDFTPHFTQNHVAIRDPDGEMTLLEISDMQRELIDWVLFGLGDSGITTEDQLLQLLVRMGIRK